jgi:hypothetical protein
MMAKERCFIDGLFMVKGFLFEFSYVFGLLFSGNIFLPGKGIPTLELQTFRVMWSCGVFTFEGESSYGFSSACIGYEIRILHATDQSLCVIKMVNLLERAICILHPKAIPHGTVSRTTVINC